MMNTNEYNEKMDLLMYLSENGYDFEDLTFDDFIKYTTVKDLREIVVLFMGEDPTA